jgi:hypothetical protein
VLLLHHVVAVGWGLLPDADAAALLMLCIAAAASAAAVGEVVSVYGMEVTLKVCAAYNEVERIKEELQLLPREMQAHLQYWSAIIDKQQRLINILLPPASTAESTADMVQQLHAGGMKVGMLHPVR